MRWLGSLLLLPLLAIADGATMCVQQVVTPVDGTQVPEGELQIDSDRLYSLSDYSIAFSGSVELRHASRRLWSDSLYWYRGDDHHLKAQGKLRFFDGSLWLYADQAEYRPDSQQFTIDGALRYLYPDLSLQGQGRALSVTATEALRFQDASLSSCPADDEVWRLRGSDIRLDGASRTGYIRHARLEWHKVPIFYLPWLSVPLDNERRSGFLMPRLAYRERAGVSLTWPWYWNIASAADARLALPYWQKRGSGMHSDWRYLTPFGRWHLYGDVVPQDLEMQQQRYLVHLRQASHPASGWRSMLSLAAVSDRDYFADFGDRAQIVQGPYLDLQGRLSYHAADYRLRLTVHDFQSLDDDALQPYARLPSLDGRIFEQRLGPWYYQMEGSWSRFRQDGQDAGSRLYMHPQIALPVAWSALSLRPAAGLHWRHYSLQQEQASDPRNEGIPWFAAEAGMRFVRRDKGRRQTLAPRLYYLYSGWQQQQQQDIPLFDSDLPPLSLERFFVPNRFVGPDRIADADQLALRLDSHWQDQEGLDRLALALARVRYYRPLRVGLDEADTVSNEDWSPWLLAAKWGKQEGWRMTADGHWEQRWQRAMMRWRYRASGGRQLSFWHYFVRKEEGFSSVTTKWPVFANWDLGLRWDQGDYGRLRHFLSLQYRSCCWQLSMFAEDDIFRGRRFSFLLGLKGLGGFSPEGSPWSSALLDN